MNWRTEEEDGGGAPGGISYERAWFLTEPVASSLYARREQLVSVYDIGLENHP